MKKITIFSSFLTIRGIAGINFVIKSIIYITYILYKNSRCIITVSSKRSAKSIIYEQHLYKNNVYNSRNIKGLFQIGYPKVCSGHKKDRDGNCKYHTGFKKYRDGNCKDSSNLELLQDSDALLRVRMSAEQRVDESHSAPCQRRGMNDKQLGHVLSLDILQSGVI